MKYAIAFLMMAMAAQAAVYGPLGGLGSLNLPGVMTDLHFYGGYVFLVGHDMLFVYDFLESPPVLKGMYPWGHSEKMPRLYRYKDLLAISYYNSQSDNGIMFFDISNPTIPVSIYNFNPKIIDKRITFLASGFPIECLSGCSIIGDFMVCSAHAVWPDPWGTPPCDGYNYFPFAIHLPDFLPTLFYVAYDPYCDIYYAYENRAQFARYGNRVLYAQGQGRCDFGYDALADAYAQEKTMSSICTSCLPYCTDSCGGEHLYIYKDLMWDSLEVSFVETSITQGPAGTILGGDKFINYPLEIYDNCSVNNIWSEQFQYFKAHENWLYVTVYDCKALLNVDVTDPSHGLPDDPVIMGLNSVDNPLTSLLLLNDTLYALGEDKLYRFDPAHHDGRPPGGSVSLREDEARFYVVSRVADDDAIQGVYLRLDDGRVYAEEIEYPSGGGAGGTDHGRPLEPPTTTVTVEVEKAEMAPGFHHGRVLVVDSEGSFAVIGEVVLEMDPMKGNKNGLHRGSGAKGKTVQKTKNES